MTGKEERQFKIQNPCRDGIQEYPENQYRVHGRDGRTVLSAAVCPSAQIDVRSNDIFRHLIFMTAAQCYIGIAATDGKDGFVCVCSGKIADGLHKYFVCINF